MQDYSSGISSLETVTMINGNLVWSFISRALNCHSNLNLLSNHIMAILVIPYPLNAFNHLLTGLKSIIYKHICNVISFIAVSFYCL